MALSLITRTRSTLFSRSNQAPKTIHTSAHRAIVNATLLAFEHKQKFVEAESLMLAVLNQKKSTTKKVLQVVEIDCVRFRKLLLEFIDSQPKTKGSPFRDYWYDLKVGLAATPQLIPNCISGLMDFVERHPAWGPSSPFKKVVSPKSNLGPILNEAEKCQSRMFDRVIGDEHLLMAYALDPRFGKDFFALHEISDLHLGWAAKVVKASKM